MIDLKLKQQKRNLEESRCTFVNLSTLSATSNVCKRFLSVGGRIMGDSRADIISLRQVTLPCDHNEWWKLLKLWCHCRNKTWTSQQSISYESNIGFSPLCFTASSWRLWLESRCTWWKCKINTFFETLFIQVLKRRNASNPILLGHQGGWTNFTRTELSVVHRLGMPYVLSPFLAIPNGLILLMH